MSSISSRHLLIDSNIIIYYFSANVSPDSTLSKIIEENYLNISVMSEVEVMGFDLSKKEQQ